MRTGEDVWSDRSPRKVIIKSEHCLTRSNLIPPLSISTASGRLNLYVLYLMVSASLERVWFGLKREEETSFTVRATEEDGAIHLPSHAPPRYDGAIHDNEYPSSAR